MRRLLPWLTAATVVGLDRASKLAVQSHIEVGALVPVVPGLAISHVHNRGIAFSLFADGGPLSRIVLHMVILTAVALITWMLVRQSHEGILPAVAFGAILGGAVGNLVDRVVHGWVVDFIHVWARLGERTWSFPDFNVADSSITVGACLLVLWELLSHRRAEAPAASDHAPDPD